MSIGYGDNPYDANLDAYEAKKSQKFLNEQYSIFGTLNEDAAAASMTILTSWHMLVGRAKITPGQTVLVMGGGSGSFLNQSISQNEKISLVINTINPPKSIDDIEEAYKVASTSGAGRTNLYVHWNQLEPEKGNFDWRVTDIMMKLNEKYNFKTTLFFSVINADRLGPFPLWMGNQALGQTLEDETIRVLDSILSRYENIDYVIFAGDLNKVLQTAVDIAHKKGQEMGIDVSISMVDSNDLTRFVTLDSEKYGKNSIMDVLEGDSYSQGNADAPPIATTKIAIPIILVFNMS